MKSSKFKPPKNRINSVSDLARYLGLSDWTVSRAINGYPAVKAATRERVLQAMREVGFHPNPMARALRGKQTGLIGICFLELHSPVLIQKVASLDRFLRAHHLRSVLAVAEYDKASEIRAIEDFRHLKVDGIVMLQSNIPTAEATALLGDMNRVFIDTWNSPEELSVRVDRAAGMSLLIEHLISLGHRRFGLFGFLKHDCVRWPGVAGTLERYGFDAEEVVEEFESPQSMERSYEMGANLAENVLAHPSPPTALLAVNDMVAAGMIQYFQKRGIQVPARFSVTGFDNLEISRFLHPTITTIDQQPHLLMEKAGELLLSQLKKGAPKADLHTVAPLLIARESTGSARSGKK